MRARLRRWMSCTAVALWVTAAPAFGQGAIPINRESGVVLGPSRADSGATGLHREPVLLELRLGQVASLAIPAERDGTRLWLPVADLLAALELEVQRRDSTQVTAMWWARREQLVVRADSQLVRRGTRRLPLLPNSIIPTPDGVLLDLDAIRQLTGTTFEVSWSDLVIAVPDIAALPVGLRVSREQARARFAARADSVDSSAMPVAALRRPLAAGAVLDYSLTVPLRASVMRPGWSSALGLDVLGGSLEVSGGAVAGGTLLPTLASWSGVWRTGRKLTQLRLGDGLGSGPRPRLGRGLFITNAPYMRPALFGLQSVRADLPPGWTLEAYRNGELVAVDTVGRDASALLQLPVLYGENPVDLLAIGPFGQTRALSQNLRVFGDVLPEGKSEYGVSVAQCRLRQQCLVGATADLRMGLTDRWTMRMGVDGVLRDSVAWQQAPYFGFSGAPINGLGVQLDVAAQSHTRAAVIWEPRTTLRFSAEQQWFGRTPLDPLFAARRQAQSSLYGLWRSFGESQAMVEGSLDYSRFEMGGDLLRGRLAVSAQRGVLRWQPYLRMDQSTRALSFAQRVGGAELQLLPDARRGRYLGAALMRVLAEVDGNGRLFREAFSAAVPLPNAFRLDAGLAWQRGQRGVMATITLSRDLSALRSYSSMFASAGQASAVQTLQGSALFTHATRPPQFVPGPSLQRAGVRGTVFLDRNANGRRDRDEPAVPGVRVQVGTGNAVSSDSGGYAVWDLVPFVPMPVTVDSLTVPSPLWVLGLSHPQVEIGPNHLQRIDIPLMPGGIVEGKVETLDGQVALGGVPLALVDARGVVAARGRTFTDGAFVLFGVRPGTYRTVIDAAWLAANVAQASAQQLTVPPDEQGATVRVEPVRVYRAERAPRQ